MVDVTLDDRGRVKGSTVAPAVEFARTLVGESEVQRRLERLSPAVRERLDPSLPSLGIVPGIWYPSEIVQECIDEILFLGLDEGEADAIAARAAAAAYEAMMTGLHRAVFKLFVGPPTYARHIQRLWSLNYDNGTIVVEDAGPGHHRNVIRGWRGYHRGMLLLNNHYKAKIFELMGCRDVSFDIEEPERGSELVVTNTYWAAT